jgi:hypothetical protein
VLGDKLPDFKDIILPRINLVQNIGQMKESFDSGQLIFNQAVVLFTPPTIKGGEVTIPGTPPVNMTVLGFRPTRYCEKVTGGVRGLIVNTEEEVVRAGGTLDYKEWELKKASGMKRFEPLADMLVAIERPESCKENEADFCYEVGGKNYALALWALRGVCYTAAAKRVFFTHRAVGCLRKGYPTFTYAVTTRMDNYSGGNSAWVPVCVPTTKSTPEFLAFVQSILNPSSEESAAQ